MKTMKTPKIVITNKVHDEIFDRLSRHAEVVVNESQEPWPRDRLLRELADATAMMAFMPDRVDAALLDHAPHLRLVACALKGFDNFDVAACTRRGVWVSIVEDLLTEPTAELTIALMIGLARHMLAGDVQVRSGYRGWRPRLYGTGLKGATVGILGMGAIGRAVAERLSGFGCRSVYWDRARLDHAEEVRLKAAWADFDTLLASADYVVCALPLTPETFHRIDADALRRMRKGALLINPSRGSVVDEAAVAMAIDGGHLGGYAADVFEMEDWARADRPRAIDGRLLARPDRTLFTPHLGSAVAEVRLAIERDAAENILDLLRGDRPRRAINDISPDRDAVRAVAS